ncbi:MAG: hypothetical protein NTV86_14175 [Planctomycetota bacterium]|nr:hypothetical protein [Planctomycetota bacterium]
MQNELLTLGQLAKILDEEEHRLIHLCERGVIIPAEDAQGRGTVRRFDANNLFCFAVALEIQRWGGQVTVLRPVIALLVQVIRLASKRQTGWSVCRFFADHEVCRLTYFKPNVVVFRTENQFRTLALNEDGMPQPDTEQVEWPAGHASCVTIDLQAIASDLLTKMT